MFQLGDWKGSLCLPVSLFLCGLMLMASVFVFTGNSNDPWQRGHPWVYTRPGFLVLQTGKCQEFHSLEVRIQPHSSSVSPGVFPGSMHCQGQSSSPLVHFRWTEGQGKASHHSSFLPAACGRRGSLAYRRHFLKGHTPCFSIDYELHWLTTSPWLPFLGVVTGD